MAIKERFEDLRVFGESFASAREEEIRIATGIPNYKCFVNDQFDARFPEDHLSRDGSIMLSLRLAIDLKGFGKPSVDRLKDLLEPLTATFKILRSNFQDSAEEIDFDWHVGEKERAADEGRKLTELLHQDVFILNQALKELMREKLKP